MKSKSIILVLFALSCLVFSSCSEKSKISRVYKKNEKEISSRYATIESILKQHSDKVELSPTSVEDLYQLPEKAVELFIDKKAVRSVLYPIDKNSCLLLDIERLFGREEKEFVAYNSYTIGRYPENKLSDLGKHTYYYTYKEEVEKFIGFRYLILADCILLISPERDFSLQTQSTYEMGEVVKEIFIYDITDGKQVDHFFLASASSDYIQTSGQPANLDFDLANNFSKILHNSVLSH